VRGRPGGSRRILAVIAAGVVIVGAGFAAGDTPGRSVGTGDGAVGVAVHTVSEDLRPLGGGRTRPHRLHHSQDLPGTASRAQQ
jgi:hypothetical protein